MKKIIFMLLFAATAIFALDLETAKSYSEAVISAKKENKTILLILTQPGCPACKFMKETTLKNGSVKDALSTFIVVDADIYEDNWNKKFRAFGTPTMYLIDKNENKIGRPIIGAMDPDEFIKTIKQIQGKTK